MGENEKFNGNKIIVAVAIFFIVWFVINLIMNYNQNNAVKEDLSKDEIIIELLKGNGALAQEGVNKLSDMNKKLETLSERVKTLEDNSKGKK